MAFCGSQQGHKNGVRFIAGKLLLGRHILKSTCSLPTAEEPELRARIAVYGAALVRAKAENWRHQVLTLHCCVAFQRALQAMSRQSLLPAARRRDKKGTPLRDERQFFHGGGIYSFQ